MSFRPRNPPSPPFTNNADSQNSLQDPVDESRKRRRHVDSTELGEDHALGFDQSPDQESLKRSTAIHDCNVPASTRGSLHHPAEKKQRLGGSTEGGHQTVQSFNIFTAILRHPGLTLEFSTHLPVNDLVSLYAISKDFHYLINTKFTSVVLGQSSRKAPESSRTFLFTYYKNLCLRDPLRTQLQSMKGTTRMIPSFQWLRMILFREEVVGDILRCLYVQGHRLPRAASLVLKKLWFTLDFSTNQRRVMLMHNRHFWTDDTLRIATMFFIKLDMRLTDPMAGRGFTRMRRMLVNQRSLSTLARVLQRKEMLGYIDTMKMLVRYEYNPVRPPQQSIFGVPPGEVGKLQYEGWGAGQARFIPFDDLICREAIRRGLHLENEYMDMVLYGYVRNERSVFAGQESPHRAIQDDLQSTADRNREAVHFDLSGDQHLVFEDSEETTSSEDEDSDTEDVEEDEDNGEDTDDDMADDTHDEDESFPHEAPGVISSGTSGHTVDSSSDGGSNQGQDGARFVVR